jgi:hypothetical protein
VVPNSQLEPAWSVLVGLSKAGAKPLTWASEVDAWKSAQARVSAFAGMTYRSIGPMGQQIALSTTAQPVAAGV